MRRIDLIWLGCKKCHREWIPKPDLYYSLQITTCTTRRDLFGDNNEKKKPPDCWNWGGEGRGRAGEKQQRICCSGFVSIRAPEATHGSPRYRNTKDFKTKIAHEHFQPKWSAVISQLDFQKLYQSTCWAPAICFSGSVTAAKALPGLKETTSAGAAQSPQLPRLAAIFTIYILQFKYQSWESTAHGGAGLQHKDTHRPAMFTEDKNRLLHLFHTLLTLPHPTKRHRVCCSKHTQW